MDRFLILLVVTCYFLKAVKSDSSSSEEDSDEIAELFGKQDLNNEIGIQKDHVKSDSSSEEEDSDESVELFGKQEIKNEIVMKKEDKPKCSNFIKTEDVESCFADRCKAKCVAVNLKVSVDSQTVPQSCNWGCKNQILSFKAAKAAYPETSAELVLGTSVDKCWDGCIDRSDGADQTSCISGCEAMRKIQSQQLRSKVEPNRNEANTDDFKESNEIGKYEQILEAEEPQEEEPVHRYYILWHPMNQENAYQSYNMIMSMVQSMLQEVDMEDERQMAGGWKDDRRQLRFPQFQPRVSALTGQDDTDGVYNKVADTLDSLKTKIQETISQPEFKENLFFVLMTICCFLLLSAIYDNCTADSAADTEEDHYHLADTSSTVKLPSYDDCIKADRYLVKDTRDMKDAGVINKADLGLSLTVVLEDEEMEQN
eukprot:GFUD01014684.1.p1 GENE.GFUD01014684.1~~GFUD01014684.1.p1  ORF type:complete len:426 (+),score=134.15 GFUD01014684.1:229-1506(+)